MKNINFFIARIFFNLSGSLTLSTRLMNECHSGIIYEKARDQLESTTLNDAERDQSESEALIIHTYGSFLLVS